MRSSRVLREVREGNLAISAKMNLSDPRVVELCGLAGYSAVWLCNEHTPNDWLGLENSVRAAKLHDMDTIIRVSKGAYSDYIKPFECDATGIMVPHIGSAEEARHVIDICRFHPLGRRPLDGGNTDGDFCQIPMETYLEHSNREKFIVLQIESPEAVEQIDEIAAVPGYEFLLFGPGDYSHRIGKAGQIQLPEVVAARQRVEAAARANGKGCFAVGVPGSREELLERGYVISNIAADVISLGNALREATLPFRCPAKDKVGYYQR